MEAHKSEEFVPILAKCLQSLCIKYLEFDGSVLITGQLHFTVDETSRDYVVNERVCKTTEGSTLLISSSCCSPLNVALDDRQDFVKEANELTTLASKLNSEPACRVNATSAVTVTPSLQCTEPGEAVAVETGIFIDDTLLKTEGMKLRSVRGSSIYQLTLGGLGRGSEPECQQGVSKRDGGLDRSVS